MDRKTAVERAAAEVLAHGGPDALTDPHQVCDAIGVALDAGATHEDIVDEMHRQRNA
jgi:hypothetical protein